MSASTAPEPALAVLVRLRAECDRLLCLVCSAKDRKRLALVGKEMTKLADELRQGR